MRKTTEPKKLKTISLRCTEAEYNTLKKAASNDSKMLSDYILNQSITGRAERNRLREKDRKVMSEKVCIQQAINELDSTLRLSQYYGSKDNFTLMNDIARSVNGLKERIGKLWDL